MRVSAKAGRGNVMRYFRWLLAAAALALLIPASMSNADPESDTNQQHPYPLLRDSVKRFGKERVNHYRQLHGWARANVGKKATGRNIVFFGMPKQGSDRLATKAELEETTAVLERWKNPPAAPTSTVSSTSSTSYSGGVPAELEAIAQCESGGDYGAVNPSSGAYGKYQILPS